MTSGRIQQLQKMTKERNAKLDDHAFCFIMCINDERALEEAIYYIQRLDIPEGYTIDLRTVKGASSMAAGYNEAMESSTAKYKIYMHQDVLIVNKMFLHGLLKFFSVEGVGMLGMVGASRIPEGAIMWKNYNSGGLYSHNFYTTVCSIFNNVNEGEELSDDSFFLVEAVDGFLMATQFDLPWREDIFKGWDFYDVSQGTEFRKAGYKVIVPHQDPPWCLHDDGFLNLRNYYNTRKIYLKEYRPDVRQELTEHEEKRMKIHMSGRERLLILWNSQLYHNEEREIQEIAITSRYYGETVIGDVAGKNMDDISGMIENYSVVIVFKESISDGATALKAVNCDVIHVEQDKGCDEMIMDAITTRSGADS